MSYLKRRRTTGALNPTQRQILGLAADGLVHAEIARRLGFHPVTVSENIRLAAKKMDAGTTVQAVAIWSRHIAYYQAANKLETGLIKDPIDECGQHVNHVLMELAYELRATGFRLLPS